MEQKNQYKYGYDFGIINPKRFERKSANTSNHYTLLIDNLPEWKQYPKRSRSVICSVDVPQSPGSENVYYVFPVKGSKVGVCPRGDIWWSFQKTLGKDYLLNTWNIYFGYLLNFLLDGLRMFDVSWDVLKTAIVSANKIRDKSYDDFLAYIYSFRRHLKDPEWSKSFFEGEDLLKLLRRIFDPRTNGFKLVTIGSKMRSGAEVWTDGKCLLVSRGEVNSFLDEKRN